MREISVMRRVSGRWLQNAGVSREMRETWQVCFYIFLYSSLSVPRSHRTSYGDQWGLKTRVSGQVPFGGLNNENNIKGLKPPKRKFWGPE